MKDFDCDLFVIGGGSGGVRAARMAAQRGARVVGPCRKVVGLHKARGAIGRWRGVCRVYARLVQHSHLRVQQAAKVAISKGPHTGAARARNDHHAVAQGWHQRAPLQGPQLLTVGPWQALRRELFGATGWRCKHNGTYGRHGRPPKNASASSGWPRRNWRRYECTARREP